MALHTLAGKPAPVESLIDVDALTQAYYENAPDPDDPHSMVSFGTSGHRGTSLNSTFTETHILAVSQAIAEYRKGAGITGPLFMGMDSHALSGAAQRTALEVLAANGVDTVIQPDSGFTPTPAISRAILTHNEGRAKALADGIVITPSHNPPADGGFKYNPSNGGPADTDITGWVQDRANILIRGKNAEVKRMTCEAAMKASTTHQLDMAAGYIDDIANAIDLDAIRGAGVRIGVDPLGGASARYWEPLAHKYGLQLEVVNKSIDATFRFMTLDHDGKIRMDCSSPYAMAGLVSLKDKYDIAFGNDPDADRHGIVTRSAGLLNPNHFLCVAIRFLLEHRPRWSAQAKVGKTLVSSGLIDRLVASLSRAVYEVPVGFKWFAPGLFDGSVCFGGEESAGASFLRRNGKVWTTDKDGLLLGLLAAEITAVTGKDPGEHYHDITSRFGESFYVRLDTPASPEQKAKFKSLTPDKVTASELAGQPITARLTQAAGNGASIGGLKVETPQGWFAARPSGTEDIYKLYAESFVSAAHLDALVGEARSLVNASLS